MSGDGSCTPGDGVKLASNDNNTSSNSSDSYIAAVDVGTTSVRCLVLDGQLRRRGRCQQQLQLLRPQPGRAELDPEQLFQNTCRVIRGAVSDAGLDMRQVTSLALTTQRGSFITWDRDTGKPYHNIVCWNDLRANQLVNQWNNSFRFRFGSFCAAILHLLTRNQRYLGARVLRLMNQQVTMRLLWCMQNIPALAEDIDRDQAMFGTVDTYLLYRLTNGRLHVTDATNAAATGFFDLYTCEWSEYTLSLMGVAPLSMLPTVIPSASSETLGCTDPDLLGAAVPLTVVIGDQSASLFGAVCWERGDVCVTLGTGSFIDVNTGEQPHTSVHGIYPQMAWQVESELCYMAEGSAGDTAASVLWGQQAGIYSSPEECSALAAEALTADAKGLEGLCFVPAFCGLAAPINDYTAAAGFLGLRATSGRPQLARALLEAVCFRVRQLCACLAREVDFPLRRVCVTGGVANSDFCCQLLADLLQTRVHRPADVETTARGAAALAGLAAGVWPDRREVAPLLQGGGANFEPQEQRSVAAAQQMSLWERALTRFYKWHPQQ